MSDVVPPPASRQGRQKKEQSAAIPAAIPAAMMPPAAPPTLATAAMATPAAASQVVVTPETGPVTVPPVPEAITKAATSPAVESDSSPAQPERHAPQPEDRIEMATVTPIGVSTTENVDKMQAVFGDMSARFKAALEKSQKLGEEMVELAKGNVEALVASARVAAKGGETIGQEVGEYGRKSFEGAIAAMKSFASVKSPTELFQLQSEYLKSSFDGAVAEASKLSESMLKVAGEAAQPLSSRYAVAAEKIKAATL